MTTLSNAEKPFRNQTTKALADRQARLDREAAALRANLRRRKQQVHARKEKAPQDEEGHEDN